MKKRLDILMAEAGLAPSREKAKALIMAGSVYVGGQRCDKAGTPFEEGAPIEVRGNTLRYVSRGGLKLEKALQVFPVSVAGRVCLDIGSSTGGFTDCMLQNGASHVYAIDVGRGQLAWSLRNDPRVTCMEKTNIRYVLPGDLPEAGAFASIDVSFMDAEIVCLIKPQFEAGREQVGRHGVVRDPEVHVQVIRNVTAFAPTVGLSPAMISFSPVKGPEGNIEYLCLLKKNGGAPAVDEALIRKTVAEAHAALDV